MKEISGNRGLSKVRAITLWLMGVVLSLVVWSTPGPVFMLAMIWVAGRLIHRYAPSDDRRFFTRLFWWGIGTRLVAATIAHLIAMYGEVGFPYLLYGQQSHDLFGDGAVASLRALWMARYWAGTVDPTGIDRLQIFGDGESFLVHLYAAFYYVFGFSPLALKWFNSLLGALTGIVTYTVGRAAVPGRGTARIASCLMMCFPSTFLWSLSNLKETPTMLVLCLIVWSMVHLTVIFQWRHLCSLGIWLIVLGVVRKVLVPPAILALLIGWWWTWRIRLRWKLGITVWLAVLVVCLNQMGMVGRHRLTGASARTSCVGVGDRIIGAQRGHALGQGSVYWIYPPRVYAPEPPGDHIPYVLSWYEWTYAGLAGWLYFLFAPFPWSVSTALQLLSFPEMILWYALAPFWILGIVAGLRAGHRPMAGLAVFALVLSVTAGFVTGNIGTAFRHRAMVIPIFLLLSAAGCYGRTLRIRHAG